MHVKFNDPFFDLYKRFCRTFLWDLRLYCLKSVGEDYRLVKVTFVIFSSMGLKLCNFEGLQIKVGFHR